MTIELTAPDGVAGRHIALDGTYNLRDTGGYPAASAGGGPGTTRWGVLLRSDALHRLTDADLAVLASRGVRHVVDLRDETEVQSAPSRLGGLDVEVRHLPVFADAAPQALLGGTIGMDRLYDAMVDQHGANLARAVAAVAQADRGAVIVHCTAGKDRTGLVVALTLRAVGVPLDVVAADYAASAGHLAGDWAAGALAAVAALGHDVPPEVVDLVTASPAPLVASLLARIEAEHGSVAGYLLAHGLTDDDLGRLRALLVEPVPPVRSSSPSSVQEVQS